MDKTQGECRTEFLAEVMSLIVRFEEIDRDTPADPNHPDDSPVWWDRMQALEKHAREIVFELTQKAAS